MQDAGTVLEVLRERGRREHGIVTGEPSASKRCPLGSEGGCAEKATVHGT